MPHSNTTEWQKSSLQLFWQKAASDEHLVQLYENEKVFLDSLEGFAGSNFIAGNAVIIIATYPHIQALDNRLSNQGFNLSRLRLSDQYITLEATSTLTLFMANDMPDKKLFTEFANNLMARAEKTGRKVVAFGEMVSVLWERGLKDATIQLEEYWNELHDKAPFTLFCAYPKQLFNENTSINNICCAHSKVINGSSKPSTEVLYKNSVRS